MSELKALPTKLVEESFVPRTLGNVELINDVGLAA
jgi:hypothetical protein